MNEEIVELKKQFACELYLRTEPKGFEHEAMFEIAQAIARRLYPFDPTASASLRIATEWAKDPLVIETFLKLKNGEAEGDYLPTKAQFLTACFNRLDQISEDINGMKKRSMEIKRANRLKTDFLKLSNLVANCLD